MILVTILRTSILRARSTILRSRPTIGFPPPATSNVREARIELPDEPFLLSGVLFLLLLPIRRDVPALIVRPIVLLEPIWVERELGIARMSAIPSGL